MISLIVATGRNSVIGKDNKLLWSLPQDLKYFREKTTDKIIIMGRKTLESIGKPLPNRINLVLTKDPNFQVKGCHVYNSIEDILYEYKSYALENEGIMVVGGMSIYNQFLPHADRIYLTKIDHEFEGDAYFPELDESWRLVSSVKGVKDNKNPYDYYFNVLERRN